ncbi:NAD(P)H-binding protein [Actinoplanes sp. TBRC 11911]|uniref:NAD(P)H-binding protein n=1 Tax=Actinoplanes sp. TBRC 11911 TaxID=2729386 RepID=UPI00145DF5D4|nr:NAD(P)H-binding protein [Actinoplanes sp. TBRC 11911]NMO53381.1 NAD(P)H-binding protein [Actinoplanes sp. TBRC 11911]
MSTFTVNGVAGEVGLGIVKELLIRGVSPADVIAIVHDVPPLGGSVDEVTDLGVQVRQADLTKPDGLADAFAGTTQFVMVPYVGFENFEPNTDDNLVRNRNALNAAKAAGATWVGYISGLRAQQENADIFPAHNTTENLIQSMFPGSFTIMRAGLQSERYTTGLFTLGLDGSEPQVAGLAPDGPVSTIARSDLASAAGQLFVTHPHVGQTLELVAEQTFTENDFVKFASDQTGDNVTFREVTEAEYRTLVGTIETNDVEAALALELACRDGRLKSDSKDLRTVLGRAPLTTPEALKDIIKAING